MSSESQELGGSNKLGRWFIMLVLVIGIPSFLLSAYCLQKLQGVVNENSTPIEKLKEKPWAADLERWIAHAYAYSLRPEPAAQAYEWAGNLYSYLENYDRAGWMYYDQARELEETKNSSDKYTALAVYERLADQWKEYPVGAKASAAATRIKTYSRP